MSSQKPEGKLDEVYEILSGEAEQEEATTGNRDSLLDAVDAEVYREREREYKDPEKHWVRKLPWLQTAEEIARDVRERHGRGLRYLTLPSYYRLDVSLFLRHNLLEVITEEDGTTIKAVYVAAFETEPTKYGRMVGHDPKFQLFGRSSIEDALVDPKNEYYDDLSKLFPFEIVNLDLTTSLTPRHDGPYSKTMQAIDAVLRRQVDCRTKWALFLTFRNKHDDWEGRTLEQLFNNLQTNLDNYPAARDAFFNLYKESNVGGLEQKNIKMCISQSVAKWLTDRANSFGMHLERMNIYEYQRYPEGLPPYTIAKHVFVFTRGDIAKVAVPAKTIPRQAWMDQDVVTCISRHKPVDVEERLVRMTINVPDAIEQIQNEVNDLCEMIG